MKSIVLGNGYQNQDPQCAASWNGVGLTIAIAPPVSNSGPSHFLFHKPDGTVIRTPVPFPNANGEPDPTQTPTQDTRTIEWLGDIIMVVVVDFMQRTGTIYEFQISEDLTAATFIKQYVPPRIEPYYFAPQLCRTRIGGVFYVGFSVNDCEADANGIYYLQWLVAYRNSTGTWESRIVAPEIVSAKSILYQNSLAIAQHPSGPVMCWTVHDGTGVINHLKLIESNGTFASYVTSGVSWMYAVGAPGCDGELPEMVAVPDNASNTIKLCYPAAPAVYFSDGGTNPDGTKRLYIKGNRIAIVDVKPDGTIATTDFTPDYANFWEMFGVSLNGDGELSIVYKHVDENVPPDTDGSTPAIKELRIATRINGVWVGNTLGMAPMGSCITGARLSPFTYFKLDNGDNMVIMPDNVIPQPDPPPEPPIPPTPTPTPTPEPKTFLLRVSLVSQRKGATVKAVVSASTQTTGWTYRIQLFGPSGERIGDQSGTTFGVGVSVAFNLGKRIQHGTYQATVSAEKAGWISTVGNANLTL